MPTASEIESAVDIIILEAGGEGADGMSAVAHVMANRMEKSGKSLGQVINRNAAFEARTNPGSVISKSLNNQSMRSAAAEAITSALSGAPDPTGGATHYKTDAVNPYWSQVYPETAKIGNHTFYVSTDAEFNRALDAAIPVPQSPSERIAAARVEAASNVSRATAFTNASGQGYVQTYDFTPHAATRTMPVAPVLTNQIAKAVYNVDPSLGVRVTSGGQAAKGTPGPRIGSTRHDLGNAADFQLTRDGKAISVSANRDTYLQVARNLATQGVPGIGVQERGAGFIHAGGGSSKSWGYDANGVGTITALSKDFKDAIQSGRDDYSSGIQLASIPVLPADAPAGRYADTSAEIAIADAMAGDKGKNDADKALAFANEKSASDRSASDMAAVYRQYAESRIEGEKKSAQEIDAYREYARTRTAGQRISNASAAAKASLGVEKPVSPSRNLVNETFAVLDSSRDIALSGALVARVSAMNAPMPRSAADMIVARTFSTLNEQRASRAQAVVSDTFDVLDAQSTRSPVVANNSQADYGSIISDTFAAIEEANPQTRAVASARQSGSKKAPSSFTAGQPSYEKSSPLNFSGIKQDETLSKALPSYIERQQSQQQYRTVKTVSSYTIQVPTKQSSSASLGVGKSGRSTRSETVTSKPVIDLGPLRASSVSGIAAKSVMARMSKAEKAAGPIPAARIDRAKTKTVTRQKVTYERVPIPKVKAIPVAPKPATKPPAQSVQERAFGSKIPGIAPGTRNDVFGKDLAYGPRSRIGDPRYDPGADSGGGDWFSEVTGR